MTAGITVDRTRGAGEQFSEVPLTLLEPAPRSLRLADQLGLWGNLGVSLLGFTGAIYLLGPHTSMLAALSALVLGTILGTAGVAAAAVPGTRTGAPAMVLLRGLFGTGPSYLPTLLNVAQLIGWTTFELVTIGTAMHQIWSDVPKWAYVVIGGVLTTAFALRPLGWIRVLRKYVTVAVLVALAYLFAQLLRHPLPALTDGNWHGFWIAVDGVIGVSVSWVPVAADYSRHSRSTRETVIGTLVGYSLTQIACYALGLVALFTVAHGDADRIFTSFMAVPLGTLAFVVIAVRELDQSFVDTYSTAVSLQNFRRGWDRRILALSVGTVATVAALALNINDYYNFLVLIGSVFVPLLGVLVVDWYVLSRGQWDLGETSRPRWSMVLAWLTGFVAYQLVNPGLVSWWQHAWQHVDSAVGFTPPSWLSASLLSFVVAAAATGALGAATRTRTRARTEEPA